MIGDAMKWLMGLALVAFFTACGGEARPPHIVLLSLDTLNRSALAVYDQRAVTIPVETTVFG